MASLALRKIESDPERLAGRCDLRTEDLDRLHGLIEQVKTTTPDEEHARCKALNFAALAANYARQASVQIQRIAALRKVRESIGRSRMMQAKRQRESEVGKRWPGRTPPHEPLL